MARMMLDVAWRAAAAAVKTPATFAAVAVGAAFRWPSYPATVMTKVTATSYADPSGRTWAGHGASAVLAGGAS